jgi:predicted transcriptional regulator
MNFPDEYHRVLWWLLVATRGGDTRTRIIEHIHNDPGNINQISLELGTNYRTVEHHIKVLLDNGVIRKEGHGYGCIYFLSDYFQKNYDVIMDMIKNKRR